MQALHQILRTFIKDYGIEGGDALNLLRKKWPATVGEPVAVHTFPDTIRKKVLTIIVDTPQWLHHLGFFKKEITDKLSPYHIESIRFRVGRLPEKREDRKAVEDIELTEADLRYIENTVRNLKDEELKEKFRRLIGRGLAKGKKCKD